MKHRTNKHESPDLELDFAFTKIISKGDVLKHKEKFFTSILANYHKEKRQNPIYGNGSMNLERVDDLEKMYFHVRVHAITGLLEWGTSATYSIPYWDIQALAVGLKQHYSEKESRSKLEKNHLESIYALLRYLIISRDLQGTADRYLNNLQGFALLGKVTRSNLSMDVKRAVSDWSDISKRAELAIQAKYKHLIFLIDQISSRKLRITLNTLVEKTITDIKTGLITIDIGVDCGLTAYSYRPAYYTPVFSQLMYLPTQTYSVAKKTCPVFTYTEIRKSLLRKSDSKSRLIDPTQDILLPWKFT